MSDGNKFFRFVWRFNAVALAVIVLFALYFAGFEMLRQFRSGIGDRPEGHFAPVSSAAEAKNTYRLKSSGTIAFVKEGGGQEVDLVFTLGDWEGSPNSYGLADVSASRGSREAYNANLLLVNGETGEGRWLFSGIARNILTWDAAVDPQPKGAPVDVTVTGGPQVISSRELYGDLRSVKALVLKVVDRDTNKDGILTASDRLSLYVFRPNDAMPVKLLDADLVTTQTQIGAGRYAITYEIGGTASIAIYSVPDFKLLGKKPLPKLPG